MVDSSLTSGYNTAMAQLHVTELLTLLQRSGLLTTAQWETAQSIARQWNKNRTSNPAAETSEILAAELVRSGLLTQWQSAQLLKGQTGFVLQKYRLLAPVGKGGMGHVFKASDSNSDAIVAIKVMSRKLTGNQTLVSRFRREIRASSLLNSPNIVRTLDAGRVGKVDFMVMEFVNGDQLDRIISRISTIPVGIACEMIRQAAIGLQHAHEQKMVHRDIKPGNLIIDWSCDGKGTVKIMDMGLVRLSDENEETTSVTRAGQVMGTPDYMSPEQGWDTATVDWRSDLYSLGCTFFRLVTGRVPFPGDNPLQVLMARCSKDAPSAKLHRADIPDAIDGILRRLTLRDPNARFQSAAEVISALTPFCRELTQDSLRKAMQDAGLEEPDFVLEFADNVEGDNQDAGYQQFLKEMDSGAAVDLMINTSGGPHQSLSSTIPVLPQVNSRTASQRTVTVKKDRTAAKMAIVSGGAAIALVTLFVLLNRGGVPDRTIQQGPDIAGQNTTVDVPVAKLKSADSVSVPGGQVV
ncbi:MAG: serine/threonine-protein kinase, partial [Planctomycetota bacterium]|nr:serine/threonine-protein kinase [Planctomycetota bacterium]